MEMYLEGQEIPTAKIRNAIRQATVAVENRINCLSRLCCCCILDEVPFHLAAYRDLFFLKTV